MVGERNDLVKKKKKKVKLRVWSLILHKRDWKEHTFPQIAQAEDYDRYLVSIFNKSEGTKAIIIKERWPWVLCSGKLWVL